jgi:hypothetical protein
MAFWTARGEGLRGIHADRRNHAHRTDHEIAGRLLACLARLSRRRHGFPLVHLDRRALYPIRTRGV